MRLLLLLALLPATLALTACTTGDDDDSAPTDDDDDADCSFTDCGGDLTGTWNVSHYCPTGEPANPVADTCPDAAYEIHFDASGTMTFDANGDYEQVITQSSTFEATIPASCIADQGWGDCAAIAADVFSGDATCTDNGGGCTCTGDALPEQDVNATGTWSSTGSRWSVALDNIGTVEGDFCVEGDVMKSVADGVEQISVFTR